MRYKLEQDDVYAYLELGRHPLTGKKVLQLLFNGELIAMFDEGEQLRYLNPKNMGEWRESK
jgi:hypothetical protein